MGLDIIVVLVLIGLTIHGYHQGFLKATGSLLTPLVGVWLAARYTRTLAGWLSSRASDNTLCLVFAVLIIFVLTYVAVKLLRYVFQRGFDYFRMWDLDRFLGGAFGLVKATVLLWIVIAFAFIAYPQGRKTISHSPVSTQILLFGEGVPFLHQKLTQAGGYIKGMSNPLERYQLPNLPNDASGTELEKALKGFGAGGN